MDSISFRPLTVDDFPMLVEWFAEPAVAQWWNQTATLPSVETKYLPRIEGREPTTMWIALIDSTPAGLLQCYPHVDYPDHDASVEIPDAVGIDYLLGHQHRGHGLAGSILRAFARLALDQHLSLAVGVATPSQANEASWRALERAGFTRRGACQPPDEPIAFIYTLDRDVLDATNLATSP